MLCIDRVVRYLENVLVAGKGIRISMLIPYNVDDIVFEIERNLVAIEKEVAIAKRDSDWYNRIARLFGAVPINSVTMEICNAGRKRLEVYLSARSRYVDAHDVVRAVALCAAIEHGVDRKIVRASKISSYILGFALFIALSYFSPLPVSDKDFLSFLLNAMISFGTGISVDIAISSAIRSKILREFDRSWPKLESSDIVSDIRKAIEFVLSRAREGRISMSIPTGIGVLGLGTKTKMRRGVILLRIDIAKHHS